MSCDICITGYAWLVYRHGDFWFWRHWTSSSSLQVSTSCYRQPGSETREQHIIQLKLELWIRDILVRIRNIWIRIQNRPQILHFSSVADKMPAKNKFYFFKFFFAHYFLKVHLHQSSKIKSQKGSKKKEVKNSRNQGSYFYCLLTEGSRSGSRSGSRKIMPDPDPGGRKNIRTHNID